MNQPNPTDPNSHPSETPSAADSPATSSPDASPGFQVGNVLKLVLPVLLLGGGAFLFFGFFDGATLLSDSLNPPLVVAKGQVLFQGKPLEGAQITTQHSNPKLTSSIGWTDKEGRFSLQTDINGYVEGAYAGEHQVVVTAYQLTSTASAPPLITPQQYASLETTPLRIEVSRKPGENEFLLNLEGEAPGRAGGGGGFDPAAIVERVFGEFDKDEDDKLTSEELQEMEADRRDRVLRADANDDGFVEREEMLEAMRPQPPRLPSRPASPDAPTPDAPTPDAPTPDAPAPDAPTPDAP